MREEMIMPPEATGDRNPGLPVRVAAARIASAFAAYEVGGCAVRSQLRAEGGLGPDGPDMDNPALGEGALEAILARFTRGAEFRAILEEAYISGILGEALEGAHRLLGPAVGDRLSRLASETLLTTELRGVMARIVAFPIVLTPRGGRDSFSALAHAALVRAATDAGLFPFGAASAAIPLRPRGVAEAGDAGLACLRRDLEAAVSAAIAGDDTAAPEDDWLPEPDAHHPIAARAFIAPVAVVHRASVPPAGEVGVSGTPEGAAAADAFLSLSADAYEQNSAEERFEFNFDLPQTVPNARATALLHAVHGELGIERDADLELMTVAERDDGSVVVAVEWRPPALGRARSCHLPGWLVHGLDLKLHLPR